MDFPLTRKASSERWKNYPHEVNCNMKENKKDRLNLSKGNYIMLVVALVVLTLGYFVMSTNDITISPLLVTLAYVALIPFALLFNFQKKDKE